MSNSDSSLATTSIRPVKCDRDDWNCLQPGDYTLEYRIKQSGPTCSMYTILMTIFTCPALLRKLELALQHADAVVDGQIQIPSERVPSFKRIQTFIGNFLNMVFLEKQPETFFSHAFSYFSPTSEFFNELEFVWKMSIRDFLSWWRQERSRNEFDLFRMGYFYDDEGNPKTFEVHMLDNFRGVDPTLFVRLILEKAGLTPFDGFYQCIKIFIDFDKFFEDCLSDESYQHLSKRRKKDNISGYYAPWANNIEELAAKAIQPFMKQHAISNENVNVTVQFVHSVASPTNRFCRNEYQFKRNMNNIFNESEKFIGEFEKILNSRGHSNPVVIQRSHFMVSLQERGVESYHSIMVSQNEHGYIEILDGNKGQPLGFVEWWMSLRYPVAIISVAFIIVPSEITYT